jgi:hypothetical protein
VTVLAVIVASIGVAAIVTDDHHRTQSSLAAIATGDGKPDAKSSALIANAKSANSKLTLTYEQRPVCVASSGAGLQSSSKGAKALRVS